MTQLSIADTRPSLVQADAVEWLRLLDNESVDLVVTDPAYESLEKHRAKGTTTRLKQSDASSNEWFDIFPNERFPELFELTLYETGRGLEKLIAGKVNG